MLLLRRVSELLERLDDQQIDDLVAGRARLAVVPALTTRTELASRTDLAERTVLADRFETKPARQPRRAARGDGGELPATVDVPALRAELLAAGSRDEAAARLDALGKISVPQLRTLAAALGVDGVGGRDTRSTVRRKIVDGTVGFRLSSRAVLGDTP